MEKMKFLHIILSSRLTPKISLENKIKKEYYKIIYNNIPELIKIPSINEIIHINRKRLLWDLDLTLRITMIV
ncbi:hypothetical protein Llc71_26190 (plasmid) [Lactococcus cremoris]|nr:hypothetical protein Llc71_26190 [Lactococcus cremoris]